MFLLNRQNDTWAMDNPGIDISNGGNPTMTAPGGIFMASINNGSTTWAMTMPEKCTEPRQLPRPSLIFAAPAW